MQTEVHKVRMTVDSLHILELVAEDNELAMGVRFGCVDNPCKIAIDDGKLAKTGVLARSDMNESFGRIAKSSCDFASSFKLGGCKRKNNTFGRVVSGIHHKTEVWFCGCDSTMFHEENVTTIEIHASLLHPYTSKGSLFCKNFLVHGKDIVGNVAIFTTLHGTRIEELRIFHLNSCRAIVNTLLGSLPLREDMCEINKVVMKRHLRKCGIKRLLLCHAYLGGVVGMKRTDEHDSAAIVGSACGFHNRDVFGQSRIFAYVLNEPFGSGCNGAVFHGVIGVPKYRRGIFTQMIPVGEINELESGEFVYLFARQISGNVIQNLDDPFVLICHNGGNYSRN